MVPKCSASVMSPRSFLSHTKEGTNGNEDDNLSYTSKENKACKKPQKRQHIAVDKKQSPEQATMKKNQEPDTLR